MALNTYFDAWNTGTSAIGTDKVIPEAGDYGFVVKAVIDFFNGTTSTTDALSNPGVGGQIKRGIGFGVSSSSEAACFGQSEDAAGTSSTDRGQYITATIGSIATAGTIDGVFSLVSLDAGNTTTREPDDAMPASMRIMTINIGGADASNVGIVRFQDSVGIGTVDVSTAAGNGFGFDPDLVFIIGIMLAADPDTVTTVSSLSIGVCDLNNLTNQWNWFGRTHSGDTTPNSGCLFRAGQVIGSTASTATSTPLVKADISVKLTGGFRVNYSVADSPASGREEFALGIKFASGTSNYSVGTAATLTNTTTDIPISTSFTARGGMIVGHGRAADANQTPRASDRWSCGGFSWDDTTLRQGSMCTTSMDTVDPSQEQSGVSHDNILQHIASDALQSEMRVREVTASAVNLRMSTAEGTAADFGYVLWGDPPAGAGGDEFHFIPEALALRPLTGVY